MNEILIQELDKIFHFSKKSGLLSFVSGGFAIDFAYGKLTREHDDIDLLVEEKDFLIWKNWFIDNGYNLQLFKSKNPDYACIMVRDKVHIDLGCVYFEDDKMLDHCDGEDKPYLWPQSRQVSILKAKVDRKEYFYLSPKTAYFLKTNHSE
jgi:uncharacterized protein YneR